MQTAERTWPPSAVHDSVQAVLRDAAFQRSFRRSLADRLLLWLIDWFERFARFTKHLPSTRSIGLAFVALLALFVITRAVIASRARNERRAPSRQRLDVAVDGDPWRAAESFASDRRYEDAAHALYRGVVLALGREERLRLDPSKTSGDYARELRRRNSHVLAAFRAFTRRFDVAVYGRGGCDATAIAELTALSQPFRVRARAA